VFVIAAAITAVLSLDATIVLHTPVVFATAARMRTSARPHVYACAHLANSASLLLPVSNLTNLLAFHASHLSFPRFAALMVLPTIAAIGARFSRSISNAPARRVSGRSAPSCRGSRSRCWR
jgi:arsenical pump membrane protein